MRQGQQNKRPRGRGRKNPNPLTRSYESNGGDVKIRGTAVHIAEKYLQLARDAQVAGDRVAGEGYLQHAEHYFRIIAAAQAAMPAQQQRTELGGEDGSQRQNQQQPRHTSQPAVGPDDPQPYANGGNAEPGSAEGTANADAVSPAADGPASAGDESGEAEPENRRSRGPRGSRRRQPYRDRTGESNGRDAPAAAQPQTNPAQPDPAQPAVVSPEPAAAETKPEPAEQPRED